MVQKIFKKKRRYLFFFWFSFLNGLLFSFCFGMEKDLHDPAVFPGKEPFTVEQIKLFNSGQLSSKQFFFKDANGTLYFVKPYSLSELVYGGIAHDLNIPCQYSWPFAIKESDFKKEQQELIPEWVKKQKRLLVIKYEYDATQSSYVLGTSRSGYQLEIKRYKSRFEFIIESFMTKCLEQTQALSDVKKFEEIVLGQKEDMQKNNLRMYSNYFDKIYEKYFKLDNPVLKENSSIYPVIYNKENGEVIQMTVLSSSGTSYNGIKEWLSSIPDHKAKYLDNEKQPIDFDEHSFLEIGMLNALFNMDDRCFHNLLYRPATKKFIAIDNENWSLYSENDYKWNGLAVRNDQATPEQKKLFVLYRSKLHAFLKRYPTPDSLNPIIQRFVEHVDYRLRISSRIHANASAIMQDINADLYLTSPFSETQLLDVGQVQRYDAPELIKFYVAPIEQKKAIIRHNSTLKKAIPIVLLGAVVCYVANKTYKAWRAQKEQEKASSASTPIP